MSGPARAAPSSFLGSSRVCTSWNMQTGICSQVNSWKRPAPCVPPEAELARRTKLGSFLNDALEGLRGAGLLVSHQTAEVFRGNRPGMVLRIRRPSVVLTVEVAGPLWPEDVWVTSRDGGLS